ncbi:MAG: hypothetical protein ACJ74U_01120 [Jatrophihabitantaceae bacterium]
MTSAGRTRQRRRQANRARQRRRQALRHAYRHDDVLAGLFTVGCTACFVMGAGLGGLLLLRASLP